MLILLERKAKRDDHIRGRLKIIDEERWKVLYSVDTLEPASVGLKRNSNLAIPCGYYDLDVTYSPRFKEDLPLISNGSVPKDRGIRIHAGNRSKDTEGCILVGEYDTASRSLMKSRQAVGKIKETLSLANQLPFKLLILESFD